MGAPTWPPYPPTLGALRDYPVGRYQNRKTASIMISISRVRPVAETSISTVVTARGGLDGDAIG